MKRFLMIVLMLAICLSTLAGCERPTYYGDVYPAFKVDFNGLLTAMDITDAVSDALVAAMNDGKWTDGVSFCAHDYAFYLEEKVAIYYHSLCGVMNDMTNERSMTLSKEEKEKINDLLGAKKEQGEADVPENEGESAGIKLVRYSWSGMGVSTKVLPDCELTRAIIAALELMKETGETVEKISDDTVREDATQLPVERGTLWIDAGASGIYRMDPGLRWICRVEGYLGKGYMLTITEQFRKMVSNALAAYPYDYYTGRYNNQTDAILLQHYYQADSTVHVHIKELEVFKEFSPKNKIVVELFSTVDQTVAINLDCYQSEDHLASGDWKEISLKAGEGKTVELSFGGWKYSYTVCITVDNTKIELLITP